MICSLSVVFIVKNRYLRESKTKAPMNSQTKKEFYQGAMRKGTVLGAVWSIMYLMFFTGTTNALSLLLCAVLFFASPFIAAQNAIKYRKQECGNTMNYMQAWIFVWYMYICATLLSTFATYLYFAFIDGGAFFMTLQNILDESAKLAGADELLLQQIEQTKNIIENTSTNNFVWQIMSNNLFNTTLLPFVIALFVKRKEE